MVDGKIIMMKKCPFCSEEIQNEAIKCRYCGEFIVDKESEKIEQPVSEKKGGGSWFWGIMLIIFVTIGTYNFITKNETPKNKKITYLKSYCSKADGFQYISTVGCGEDKSIAKEVYDAKIEKKTKKLKPISSFKVLKAKITHCIYSNGKIYYANKYCKHINNETIVGITKEDFNDIKRNGVDWITIFILKGGDPSKIVKNNKENEKVIAELQEKIVKLLEDSKATNDKTNNVVNSIRRTKDLKTLACILGGNFQLNNITEFIEDCY